MILSYKTKRVEAFARGEHVREFSGFDRQGWKRLEILEAATSLEDLRALPNNRLEALRGGRQGQFSIRINLQWRICSSGRRAPQDRLALISWTITEGGEPMSRPPIHPGEILADELKEVGVTPTELARQVAVPANRISEIIRGRRSITGDTALRLGHWFGTTPQFWVNLQTAYDLRVAAQQAGDAIASLPRRTDDASAA